MASRKLPGGKLVEANRYARVYYNAEDEDIGICRPGKREPDFAPLAEAVYPRPAIDLVGPYLGYAATATEGQENVDIVAIVDVRSMDPRFITDLQGGGRKPAREPARIDRLDRVPTDLSPLVFIAGRTDPRFRHAASTGMTAAARASRKSSSSPEATASQSDR